MSGEVEVKSQGEVNLQAIHEAGNWLYHDESHGEGPEYPGDDVMIEAVTSKMRQWVEWKDRGLDIVAHSILDDIATFVEKLKELT